MMTPKLDKTISEAEINWRYLPGQKGWLITNLQDIEDIKQKAFQAGQAQALKEFEDRDIDVELNTRQCLEVAQQVYDGYIKAMKPPIFAMYSFPDWLQRQLLKQK